MGGDDDEKYEDDDFPIAEASMATCDRMFGMCFPNVNVGRVFYIFTMSLLNVELVSRVLFQSTFANDFMFVNES